MEVLRNIFTERLLSLQRKHSGMNNLEIISVGLTAKYIWGVTVTFMEFIYIYIYIYNHLRPKRLKSGGDWI